MIRWGIVGLGRAGLARRRALSARNDCAVVIECSRRDPGLPKYKDVLQSDVHALALCRESERHAKDTLAALRAGKHVLIEYPLAMTGREANDLLMEAQRVERLVHVGHLMLLSPFHSQVQEVIARTQLSAFTYTFRAGYGRAVRPLSEAKLWGQNANSRIQAIWSWFGPLRLLSSRVECRSDGYQLTAEFLNAHGISITLCESRLEGQTRSRELSGLTSGNKTVQWPQWRSWRGGFAADTEQFMNRLSGSIEEPYLPLSDLVDVVALSERVSAESEIVDTGRAPGFG